MILPSGDLIASTLVEYGVAVAPSLCDTIRRYISLLSRWNERISLTTVTDPSEILRFHFGESMFAASAVPILYGRLADVGAGAGFPGIPLKLIIPSLQVMLIESNVKKAAFLSECIRDLDLSGVEVYRGRYEDFPAYDAHFDFVTARALGDYSPLVKWSRAAIAPAGKLVLWLGERDSIEISRETAFKWRRPISVPGSNRRTILAGAPR